MYGVKSATAHVYHKNLTEFAVCRRVSNRKSRLFHLPADDVWHAAAVAEIQRRRAMASFLM